MWGLLALPLMSDTLVSGLIQLGISLGGAGLVVQLLLLRQNRRKIAGDASSSEANAASTLSGAAIKMVENAQAQQKKAEDERDRLQTRLDEANVLNDRQNEESNRMRWRLHHRDMYVAILQAGFRGMGAVPPDEPEYQEFGHRAPPTVEGPNPALPPV